MLSTQAAGLTLRLQQRQNVSLAHRSLHVADDGAVRRIQKLHAHLRHTTSGPGRVSGKREKKRAPRYPRLPVRPKISVTRASTIGSASSSLTGAAWDCKQGELQQKRLHCDARTKLALGIMAPCRFSHSTAQRHRQQRPRGELWHNIEKKKGAVCFVKTSARPGGRATVTTLTHASCGGR